MSRSSETRAIGPWRPVVTLLVAAGFACAAAAAMCADSAGALTIHAQAADPLDEARRATAPGRSQKSSQSLFRCWQDGQMIFEGRGYGALPQSQIAAETKQGDGTAGRVQVVDLYQGICILELPK